MQENYQSMFQSSLQICKLASLALHLPLDYCPSKHLEPLSKKPIYSNTSLMAISSSGNYLVQQIYS